jgi:hypothetical protein
MAEPKIAGLLGIMAQVPVAICAIIPDLLIGCETLLTQAYQRGVSDGIGLAREQAMRALSEAIEGEEGELPPNTEAPSALTGNALPRGTMRATFLIQPLVTRRG